MRRIEQQLLPVVTAENSNLKDLGIVWQEETFARPDVLPLYGSSELIKRAPNKASQFFASYPTGFVVSPVGRPSCTSLVLLEKLAASASQAKGHKVVLCVSPSWFVVKGANHDGFGGNFSMMQASELFFSAPLSMQLKHAIAGRMLRYSEVFNKSPVLAVAVRGLASDRLQDRLLYYACMPFGRLQNVVYRLQDHFEVIDHLKDDRWLRHMPERHEVNPDWDALLAASRQQWRPLPDDVNEPERTKVFTGDGMFLQSLQHSYEWGDMELLLRTARELGVDPLLLSIPIEYAHFEHMGVSANAIDAYAWRLNEFAQRYQIPVVDFADFGDDPRFFADHFGHPSGAGWLYIDRALDDFYHGRPSRQRTTLPSDPEMPPGEMDNR
ncbi:D-alanine transfer protein-like protein [Chthoniobacter flavus Ellin428]|uniref:D-alanine transfer protein-like protein n=2 Tax=Chthoniobacter flavus TaxID=191863 RepID=B4D3B0_9BACT|nr:D-alanine transfer protein-like protein [Chthoniobacter flavus Ellin428]